MHAASLRLQLGQGNGLLLMISKSAHSRSKAYTHMQVCGTMAKQLLGSGDLGYVCLLGMCIGTVAGRLHEHARATRPCRATRAVVLVVHWTHRLTAFQGNVYSPAVLLQSNRS